LWGGGNERIPNAVVYTEIHDEFIQGLFLKCSGNETAFASVNNIDNITVFTGNKTYYYPQSIIETWEQKNTEGGILLQLPVKPYAKSVIKPWINWYGDLNFALKNITAFLINPFSFSSTCFFISLFIALLWRELKTGIDFVIYKHGKKAEIILLLFLLVFAFLLRINGFTRHSSWLDELYSSITRANPALPFINIFKDPGNPPLFYLVLRLWHKIFGWSEPSGRMLCVMIGIAGIVSLYCFVKMMCGRKCAFLAAFLLTINSTHIGFSNEIRAYILEMALVPLVSQLFFVLLRKDSLKNYALYVLAGSALVNTHYYGVLLILFNFIYYVLDSKKQLFVKKTVCFTAANILVALSLLPFFVITAFSEALLDGSFNTWIPKPGNREVMTFFALLAVCVIFPRIKKMSKTAENLSSRCNNLPVYAVYAVSFIFISVFLVSLKRPMLTWRYLSICLPLVISVLPIVFPGTNICEKLKTVIHFILLVVFINFTCNFRMFGGGYNDTGREAQEYISADAEAHSLKAAELIIAAPMFQNIMSYYDLREIAFYSSAMNCDVVYVSPLHTDEEEILRLLAYAGLDEENILRIKTTNGKYILKKYLLRDTGD
jgi:hypothetical protein